jgi:hypothetical protein
VADLIGCAVFVPLQDLGDVERRAQAAEIRHQELSAKLPEATAPLLRQISSLQDASSAQVTSQLLAVVNQTFLLRSSAAERAGCSMDHAGKHEQRG